VYLIRDKSTLDLSLQKEVEPGAHSDALISRYLRFGVFAGPMLVAWTHKPCSQSAARLSSICWTAMSSYISGCSNTRMQRKSPFR
jgi:hypothetical protein